MSTTVSELSGQSRLCAVTCITSANIHDISLCVVAERIIAEKETYEPVLRELNLWKKQQRLTLESIRADRASKEVATSKFGLAERRIKKELGKLSDLDEKGSYIQRILNNVLAKCARLAHLGLLERMFGQLPDGRQLPREIRNMVYEYFLPEETSLNVVPDSNCPGFSIETPKSNISTPIRCPCPTVSTTHPLADEILETFYHRKTFRIVTPRRGIVLLRRLLRKPPWLPNANVAPAKFIRRIAIAIPNGYGVDVGKTIDNLESLDDLLNQNATVTLLIDSSNVDLAAKFLELSRPLLRELREKGLEIRVIDRKDE